VSDRIARLTVTFQGVDTDYVLAADYERLEAEVKELRERIAAAINRENDSKAEVERLREDLEYTETKVDEYEAGRNPNDQFLAQLDRANAAEAEVERLRVQLEGDIRYTLKSSGIVQEREELLAEVKRLRAALQAILDYVPEGFISPMDDEDTLNFRAIARAALAKEEA
jgi:chromosome segregation ATPase